MTPNEIARQLGVTGLTFRNWLRAEKAAGHPLLASHEYKSRYGFSRADADQLAGEYRASSGRAHSAGAARSARAVPPSRSPVQADSSALPPLPSRMDRPSLQAAGFEGWVTWLALDADGFGDVPSSPGVYVVLRPSADEPRFVYPSPAGRFKAKDPSVLVDRLRSEWVPHAHLVYIGKAAARAAGGSNDALRKRLHEFGRFGAGEPIGHWGGRLIWQLADVSELLVAWHAVSWGESARDYEKRLLARFGELHSGRRPFANLTG